MTSTLIPLIASILAAVHAPEAKEAKTPDKYVMLAAIVADRGDLPMGEKILRDGLQEFPAASGMHLVLGRILEKKGAAAEAFYEYQWEVALSGVDSEPGDEASARTVMLLQKQSPARAEMVAVMHALQIAQSSPTAAVAALESIVKTRGHRAVLDLYSAEISSMAGDDAAAIASFKRTIEEAPALVPAYVELSHVLAKQGHEAEAKALLEQARRIDPTNWRLAAR